VSFGTGCLPINPIPVSIRACHAWRRTPLRDGNGFTKSSTTASASSRTVTGPALRLITRNGHDFASRFPLIVAAVAALPARSCVVDGEAIACEKNGLSVFEMIRWRQNDSGVTHCAFDLLELDGEDLRREPIEVRKATLKGLLRRARPGIAFNRHFEVDGAIVYEQACALGCEGIVSKRLGTPYRSGRNDSWIKVKNPNAPAARRVDEEDWT
jgi:bifunctional non-homologous end joining protein LigD